MQKKKIWNISGKGNEVYLPTKTHEIQNETQILILMDQIFLAK